MFDIFIPASTMYEFIPIKMLSLLLNTWMLLDAAIRIFIKIIIQITILLRNVTREEN